MATSVVARVAPSITVMVAVPCTVGIVAALVGDIDLVGHRVDVQADGIDSHIDRGGVVGRAVDGGHRPLL